jgi:hypothetical protein
MRQLLHLRVSFRIILLVVLAFAAASARSNAQPAGAGEPSCRSFVQKFYDGYWNQYLPKMKDPSFSLPGTDAVLRARPPVLSQELIDLIVKDEKRSKSTGDVGNLDFDPFLNSQDPDGKYLVTKVEVANATCRARISRAQVVAELKPSGASWIFVNFHYSYYTPAGKKDAPDADLLQILKQ